MITHLLLLGFFAASTGSGSSEVGAIIASDERTAVLPLVQSASTVSGAPNGSTLFRVPFDPADHAPYAVDFSAFLPADEKIAEIQAITMTSAAALLGVGVDGSATYQPVIDAVAGKKVQVWYVVDQASWANPSFNASGVLLPMGVRILTDSTPPKQFERTVVLTVRQL